MKTVAKNRKKLIESIFAAAQSTSSYHFDDMYGAERGAPPVDWIKKELERFDFAKLYYMGKDETGLAKYWVRVHSNCNYDFKSTVHLPGQE